MEATLLSALYRQGREPERLKTSAPPAVLGSRGRRASTATPSTRPRISGFFAMPVRVFFHSIPWLSSA